YQARASRGAFDLLGVRAGLQVGIQVKRTALPLRFTKGAWHRLEADAQRLKWRWSIAAVSPADGRVTFLDPKKARAGKAITPDHGSAAGGTTVTIAGANFQSGANVTIGGAAATQVFVNSALTLSARTPAGAAGKADVTVLNPDGQHGTLSQAFTYQPVVNATI